MTSHWLITYPRSGTDWTRARMKSLKKLLQQRDPSLAAKPIKNSHLGFNPPKGTNGTGPRLKQISPGDHLTVQFRDGIKSVVSTFYYLLERTHGKDIEAFRQMHGTSNLDDFIKSPWGVDRFALYLDRLKEFKDSDNYTMDFIYYEDIGTRDFIYQIPKMLGTNIIPTDEEVDRVYQVGLEIVNLVDADHSALTNKSREHILKVLNERCKLEEYRDRYLEVK